MNTDVHLCIIMIINCHCCCFSQGPPKYTKSVLKKGDKTNFPKKGDTVSCWYTGTLEDGTVFDTNIPAGMTNLHLEVATGVVRLPWSVYSDTNTQSVCASSLLIGIFTCSASVRDSAGYERKTASMLTIPTRAKQRKHV